VQYPMPALGWNLPAAQAAHWSAPGAAAKLPAAHGLQAATDVAPTAVEKRPIGHSSQVAERAAGWKLPAGHSVQLCARACSALEKLPGAQALPANAYILC